MIAAALRVCAHSGAAWPLAGGAGGRQRARTRGADTKKPFAFSIRV